MFIAKKFFLPVFIILATALTACGGGGNEVPPLPTPPPRPEATPVPTTPPAPVPTATVEPVTEEAIEQDTEIDLASIWTPEAPITIITHVAPGGGMDVATRLLVELAAKYTDATFEVVNSAGGATMIATNEVLERPADGYTIFGMAMSHVNNIATHEHDRETYIDGYEWIAKIQRDPAAVIITQEARDAGMDFEGILEQAREMDGAQIWAIPVIGGNKHFEALLTWQTTGIEATAVPFESGPLGAEAVLNGEAHVQLGNPFDTAGRDLWVAAIASPTRMPGFEDSPTFEELGYPELNGMHMWRGYAVKRGTPQEMIQWFQQLVYLISQDEEWIEYNAGNAIEPTAIFTQEFTAAVHDTLDTTEHWMRYLGLLD